MFLTHKYKYVERKKRGRKEREKGGTERGMEGGREGGSEGGREGGKREGRKKGREKEKKNSTLKRNTTLIRVAAYQLFSINLNLIASGKLNAEAGLGKSNVLGVSSSSKQSIPTTG